MYDLKIERIYQKPIDDHGLRILVDRLWPRGISKVNAKLDQWAKEIGPTNDLRKWFGHDPTKYEDFKVRYQEELAGNPALPAFIALVKEELAKQNVILLFGAKDTSHNQAVVLQAYLRAHLA
ncbi:MAG: DUF488 family protein [Lactobacillus sp.]|nr:DUF488 family protein [Lactobacillus sp.]MDN6052090.1 DUF488 family protein [Lactobacillus sp.]